MFCTLAYSVICNWQHRSQSEPLMHMQKLYNLLIKDILGPPFSTSWLTDAVNPLRIEKIYLDNLKPRYQLYPMTKSLYRYWISSLFVPRDPLTRSKKWFCTDQVFSHYLSQWWPNASMHTCKSESRLADSWASLPQWSIFELILPLYSSVAQDL